MVSGSSPLTRGAHGRSDTIDGEAGLIPAYAGSTSVIGVETTSPKAHPRLRGEHQRVASYCRARSGSSPLTRGARHYRRPWLRPHWLIPAYAGSTKPRKLSTKSPTAHPRLRGEHVDPTSPLFARHGSSPLTRGAPLLSRNNMSLRAILHTASSGGLKAYLLEYANLPLSVGCTSCGLGGLSTNPSDASSALVYVGASLT